jgi:hypothetical protein
MPSSAPDHLTALCKHLLEKQPKTILDVGIGFGKLGFLAREYLETWKDRVHPKSWEVKIHGIEAWEPYTTLPWIKTVYNDVYPGEVQRWCADYEVAGAYQGVDGYDLIVAGDVIEHLPKDEAVRALKTLLKACKGSVVVNLPLGAAWLNNQIVDGNAYEKHRSAWEAGDLQQLVGAEVVSQHVWGSSIKPVGYFVLKGQWKPAAAIPRMAPAADPAVPVSKNVILHVHNVRRCGGTGNFVYDFARCFPEFHHVALCVNDAVGDQAWIQAVSATMRSLYAPRLTPELLEDLNPQIVVLHGTTGARLGTGNPKADHPYSWLGGNGKRFVIAYHHIPTYPLVPADLDVFVSEHIKSKYQAFLGRMKAHAVIPPCTDLKPYVAVPRQGTASAPLVLTTAGKACDEARSALAQRNGAQGAWTVDHTPPGKLGAMPGYLRRFPYAVVWSGHQETWCRTVSEALAAGCVTLAHRAGAIPEQIEHGRNGFLFDGREDLLQLMDDIESNRIPPGKRQAVAQAGREWARHHVGFERLKADLYPHLMRGVLGSAS